jgi:pimeloyl-ACP methyl ester carboxylesterase
MVLASGITLVALDFSGSGRSEGEYISLGFYERDDVKTLIHHLRQSNKASAIGLWGRSMGAVTALMHADSDPTIACLVLDSAFTRYGVGRCWDARTATVGMHACVH